MANADAAQSALSVVERQMAELNIYSPLDGVVETMELEPGDLIAPNAPVLSIMDTDELWVRAYVPENHLGLEIGSVVSITVDSYESESFQGHISFISRQAEFTPGNVQTPEDRSKQVFRIKVIIEEGLDRLRPGMGAEKLSPPAPLALDRGSAKVTCTCPLASLLRISGNWLLYWLD